MRFSKIDTKKPENLKISTAFAEKRKAGSKE